MNNVIKKAFYWFFTVSRGYSAPMSILNWLVAFVFILKAYENPHILYGIIAMLAILSAHLGTNLFDDFIDYLLKAPKQKCKTEYIEKGFTTINKVLIAAILNFSFAFLVGVFFFIKFGLMVALIAGIAGIIILLYPKLNNFALGEIAVGSCFGVLMFAGISLVMLGNIDLKLILLSIPVSILTLAVVFVHSIMDFDFDKENNKNTLSVLIGSREKSLILLMIFYIITFLITIYLCFVKFLPLISLLVLFLVIPTVKLYKSMGEYAKKPTPEGFMPNFILARNISLFYNILLILTLLIKG